MAYIKNSFLTAIAYRSENILSMISEVVYIVFQMLLWSFLYKNDPAKIHYMLSYVGLSAIINTLYTRDSYTLIEEKVSKGDFLVDLMKPVNFIYSIYLKSIGLVLSKLLFMSIPFMFFIVPMIYKSIVVQNLPFSLIIILLGHINISLLYTLCGLTSFVMLESWPIKRLLDDTIRLISGVMIPIKIFPVFLQKISKTLPFEYLYYFPITLLLSPISRGEVEMKFRMLLIWTIVLISLVILVYRKVMKHIVVQGG